MVLEQKVLPAQKFNANGSLINDEVSRAFNNNFISGQHVRLIVNCGKSKTGQVGVVKFVTSNGISIMLEDDSIAIVKAKALEVLDADAKKTYMETQKKQKADDDAAKKAADLAAAAAESLIDIPKGHAFVLASQAHTASAIRGWVEHSLWKICVNICTGQSGLRLVDATPSTETCGFSKRVIATEKHKEKSLCLVPFGNVVTSKPSGIAERIVVKFELPGGNKTTTNMWVEEFESEGGDTVSSPPVLPAMSPFWFVQGIIRKDDAYKLSRVMHSFDVSSSAQCVVPKSVEAGGCKVVKKAASTLKVVVEIPLLTNEVDVPKGAELWSEE
jgi:RNase P/RNase MRP subunit p29